MYRRVKENTARLAINNYVNMYSSYDDPVLLWATTVGDLR